MDTQIGDVAIRKRTQIANANRVMFIWVAAVSVLFGFALVASIFLTKLLFFNEKVLSEKSKTVATLKLNNSNVSKLEEQIKVLNTNQLLINNMTEPDTEAVQVVLDALPSEANSPALGASIQNKLINDIPGLTVDTFQVIPVDGVESLTDTEDTVEATTSTTSNSLGEISFNISVYGDDNALKQVLVNLEKSIRTIQVTSLKIESQGTLRSLKIEGKAFYLPARVVKLENITVKQQ